MYEGDAPLAERRAAALALDRDLLRDLLGAEELRELIDADVLADLELELQRLVEGRLARDADELHDQLRLLGPLSLDELGLRSVDGAPVKEWVDQLVAERRAFLGVDRRRGAARARPRTPAACATPSASPCPSACPRRCTDSVPRPAASTSSPATPARTVRSSPQHAAGRYGWAPSRCGPALEALERDGRVVRGEFRPDGVEREWCDDDVLRQLRRRSLAALRKEVEPVDAAHARPRSCPRWHGIGRPGGASTPWSTWWPSSRARPWWRRRSSATSSGPASPSTSPPTSTRLCTSGEVVWVGAGAIGSTDGRIRLAFRDQAGLLLSRVEGFEPDAARTPPCSTHLDQRGASFWADLTRAAQQAGQPFDDPTVLAALWDLVWAGLVTNDSLAPLRAFVGTVGRRSAGRSTLAGGARGRPRPGRLARLGPAGRRRALVARRRRCSSRSRPPPRPPTPGPCSCSSATACSPARRRSARAPRAASPACTPCSRRSRSGARCAGATSSPASAPPSSPCRARSTGSAASARRRRRRPIVLAATDPAQPFGAAIPWPELGRAARPGPPARWWCWPGPTPSPTSSGAPTRCCASPPPTDDDRWADALGQLVDGGRFRSLEIRAVDGVDVHEADAEVHEALQRRRLPAGLQGLGEASPLRVGAAQSSE